MKCEICTTWTNGITPLRIITDAYDIGMGDDIEVEEIYLCGNCAIDLLRTELSFHSFNYISDWITTYVKNKKN